MTNKQNLKQSIDLFKQAGFNLTILAKRGKNPIVKDWAGSNIDIEQLYKAADAGHNIGCVLNSDVAVIDVDPRNFPEGNTKVFEDFCEFTGLKPKNYTVVKTGGGGYHVYMKLPSIAKGMKFYNEKSDFPGIEFKTPPARQLLIPGCIHPDTGKEYTFIYNNDFNIEAPVVLIDFFKKEVKDNPVRFNSARMYTNKELAQTLELIDIMDYRDNHDGWFSVMAASHDATHGEGIEEFLAWSLQDPKYKGQDSLIRYRWNSLNYSKVGNITGNTLLSIAGPSAPTPFKEDIMKALGTLDTDSDTPETLDDILSSINNIINDVDKIKKVVAMVTISGDILDREKVRLTLEKTGMARRTINNLFKQYTEKADKIKSDNLDKTKKDNSQPVNFADYFTKIYEKFIEINEIDLVSHKGKIFKYESDLGYWEEIEFIRVINDFYNYYEYLTKLDPQKYDGSRGALSYIFGAGKSIITAKINELSKSISELNLNEYKKGNNTYYNTRNNIVVVDSKGNITFEPHNKELYFTGYFDVEVDENTPVKSKVLNNFLNDVLNTPKEAQLMKILMGYSLQPVKQKPVWVMLNGDGANGKSVLLDLLFKLSPSGQIGSLDIKAAAKGNNNHATANLPGKLVIVDDDMQANTTLPDRFIKMVSSNTVMEANPKGKAAYNFVNTATLFTATNNLPSTQDISHGLVRRLVLFNFNNTFSSELGNIDYNMSDKLQEDLASIFMDVVSAFAFFKASGSDFSGHADIATNKAKEAWFEDANPVNQFLADTITKDSDEKVENTVLWDYYNMFCVKNNIRNSYSNRGLYKKVRQAGYKTTKSNGRIYFEGMKLKQTTADTLVSVL